MDVPFTYSLEAIYIIMFWDLRFIVGGPDQRNFWGTRGSIKSVARIMTPKTCKKRPKS